jgi:hypothetical protein
LKRTFFLHKFIKGSSIAVFINKIEVVGSFEHINIFYNVGAVLESG